MEIGFNLRGGGNPSTARFIVVCGLKREAKIARPESGLVVIGGGDAWSLGKRLDAIDPVFIEAVISFGLAGALDPSLKVGDLVAPVAVTTVSQERYPTSPEILEGWAKVLPVGSAFENRVLLGVDKPAMTRTEKIALRRRSAGAAAVDMESHVAAAYAARYKKRFAALRVISDDAQRDLPPVAGRAMRPDGSIDVLGVLAGIQMPALIATGRDAGRACRELGRVRGLLGGRLGLVGLDL